MAYHVVYTADLHGNEIQYQKLVTLAIERKPCAVIIGGDLAPKQFENPEDYISGQRRFLIERLPQLLVPLREGSPSTRIFLMLGNDDCAANMDVLESNERLYELMHGRRIKLTDSLDLVGYSIVPITPFDLKDWEKFDLTRVLLRDKLAYHTRNRKLDGVASTPNGFIPFAFKKTGFTDSIETDLAQPLFRERPEHTVYVLHSPPDHTALDQVMGGYHVGSFAIRAFIGTAQPLVTLHGHIHETVRVSGRFSEQVGRTVCLSPGNDNVTPELAVLVLDLEKPEDAKRIIVH